MKISTIHTRINLMMILIGVIFLLLILKLYQTTDNQEKLILKESQLQFQNEANLIISNKIESLKQVAIDYTFWDDFVNHLHQIDTAWYSNNIGTILKSFRLDYVCVFDSAFHLTYEASASPGSYNSLTTIEMLKKLKEKKFMNYFQVKSDSLYEISSATVHPDMDPTHLLTPPSGYLLLIKKWDKQVFDNFSSLSGDETIFVLPSDSPNVKDDFITTAFYQLYDWNNQLVAQILFKRPSTLLRLYHETSIYMILTMLISTILSWLIINYITRRWVTKPLKLVTKILKTDNMQLVVELKQCPGEFKQIGILFNEFVDQKKELIIAKEKAVESDLLKSAFLANMSHEIRTPMNGILGFVELLKEPKLSGEEQLEYVTIIEESGRRMLNIINDIISISKVEAGQTEIVTTETNINDQIRFIYTFFKPETEQKGLQFIYNQGLSDLESNLRTDREKLYAILTNLVKNAIKFTNRGFIDLGYIRKGDFLEFYIRDSGVGIRDDQQKVIFERFRQASESLARAYEGAGLGLAISKAYVEMLGGKIWLESELGKGSIFYFTIPFNPQLYTTASEISQEAGKIENSPKWGLKILVAEDDVVSELFLRKLIKPFCKEIIKVTTGKEAVAVCKNSPDIDLVLMDIQMPEMDGYEATRLIREFNPKVVIVAQTALGLKGEKEKAREAGCTDFIAKPISVTEFKELIHKYFENQI